MKKKAAPKKARFRKWMWALLALFVASASYVGYEYYQITHHWYTEYKPPVTRYINGQEVLDSPSLHELLRNLPSAYADLDAREDAVAVKAKVYDYLGLLQVLAHPPKDVSVDFIAMYHVDVLSFKDGKAKVITDVKASQDGVVNLLKQNSYDVIGREGSWSEDLDLEKVLDENMETARKLGVSPEEESEIRAKVAKDIKDTFMVYEGVLRYKQEVPKAYVLGIEDKDLFYLNSVLDDIGHDGDVMRTGNLQRLFRALVWVRTEVALAKTLQALQRQGKKRAVIVMGQNHRYPFVQMAKAMGLNYREFHTVPKSSRSDETF